MPSPSDWVKRWAGLIRPGGTVLDVACGSGRHFRWLAALGFQVTGVDRDAAALQGLAGLGETVLADIEGAPWPLPGRQFDAVFVTNYLWRALTPTLRASLNEGGLYLHETFAEGQQHIGRPSRPEFLLQRGELLTLTVGLRTVAFEDGWLDTPPRCVQRIAAIAGPGAGAAKIALSPNPGPP
jgi:SAM-dependent methyltransferase